MLRNGLNLDATVRQAFYRSARGSKLNEDEIDDQLDDVSTAEFTRIVIGLVGFGLP